MATDCRMAGGILNKEGKYWYKAAIAVSLNGVKTTTFDVGTQTA